MKVGFISDVHGVLPPSLPSMDVLCIVGDILPDGRRQREWLEEEFIPWIARMKSGIDFFILVGGNHDFLFEKEGFQNINNLLPPSVVYLENSGVVVNEVFFWGIPFVQPIGGWAFERTPMELTEELKQIPKGVHVLLTHQPPIAGELGVVQGHLLGDLPAIRGSAVLTEFIEKRKDSLAVVACGHVHEGYGMDSSLGTPVYNVSMMNRKYIPTNPPVVLEITREGKLGKEEGETE